MYNESCCLSEHWRYSAPVWAWCTDWHRGRHEVGTALLWQQDRWSLPPAPHLTTLSSSWPHWLVRLVTLELVTSNVQRGRQVGDTPAASQHSEGL